MLLSSPPETCFECLLKIYEFYDQNIETVLIIQNITSCRIGSTFGGGLMVAFLREEPHSSPGQERIMLLLFFPSVRAGAGP